MIRLDKVTIRAGSYAMTDISFTVEKGGYGVLMGPTGCGKTTLLETICGLRPVASGQLFLMGQDVARTPPAHRGIGFVPQDTVLFPAMTVRDHLAFALRVRRWRPEATAQRVAELADLLGIESLLSRKPQGLSGGEAQRVALGRALAAHPPILCMDEPLSALDHERRLDMCALLQRVKDHMNVTVLHVTHDRNEAARLAGKLLRFDDGAIMEASP
jgi:ABC-type sugar transport system ATPase subunit